MAALSQDDGGHSAAGAGLLRTVPVSLQTVSVPAVPALPGEGRSMRRRRPKAEAHRNGGCRCLPSDGSHPSLGVRSLTDGGGCRGAIGIPYRACSYFVFASRCFPDLP
ncbi:hypothetical protein GCM10010266_02010 [Streptomyces griseomycini]|nr:hypothetical protein GCM10010266_02010 [Streptomyces griseomycini]GGR02963.1 hypothetical protein GCM10015536_04950 [Streptomyces griseomycini]